jgi:ribosomal protein L11 methyltransferase
MSARWLEFSVETDGEAAEAVVELFNRYGQGGAVVETQVDCFEHEIACDTPLAQVRVKTYLPLDTATGEPRRRLEEGLWHLSQIYPMPPPVVHELGDDWIDAWKQQYHRLRVGRRIVIVPEWEAYTPMPQEIVIRLEPGMAFGTGLHPTTRLCLAAIETHLPCAASVLDVGTGSGILSIAAAKLGAASVLALDADPVAVAVAAENVARNGVTGLVTVRHAILSANSKATAADGVQAGSKTGGWLPQRFEAESGPEIVDEGAFGLVAINILAPVIVALAPALAARTARAGTSGAAPAGGKVIASGLIRDQEVEVIDALAAQGLEVVERTEEGDWVCLVTQSGARA